MKIVKDEKRRSSPCSTSSFTSLGNTTSTTGADATMDTSEPCSRPGQTRPSASITWNSPAYAELRIGGGYDEFGIMRSRVGGLREVGGSRTGVLRIVRGLRGRRAAGRGRC